MKKILFIALCCIAMQATAQTDLDGLMMDKKLFCTGASYGNTSFTNYWEGTLKRENKNLGRVSASGFMLMGNYGAGNKLNIIFGLPYLKTKASAGQLKGQQGLQDLSVSVKWLGVEKHIRKSVLKGFLVSGFSVPVSNYTPDLLPLSIGLHCKTASLRIMADYQHGNWFGTVSGTYVYRGNVQLDRETYYTTTLHYTNMVQMPDAGNFNFRAGYRSMNWIMEAIANRWVCFGGFDISRNNMPFVSNKMNATTIGLHIKYETDFVNGLSIVADGMTTLGGRNSGQSKMYNAGFFYIMDFNKKKSKEDNTLKK
jgi:Putative MetA-pathway of phenol degradation